MFASVNLLLFFNEASFNFEFFTIADFGMIFMFIRFLLLKYSPKDLLKFFFSII